jgi:cell wall-associated NlpC family hydrolase
MNKRKLLSRRNKKHSFRNEISQFLIFLISGAVLILLICGYMIRSVTSKKNSAGADSKAAVIRQTEEISTSSEVIGSQSTDGNENDADGNAVKIYTEKIKADALQKALAQYSNLGIVHCSGYINFRSKPDSNNLTSIMGMLRNGAAVNIVELNPNGADGWAHVTSGGMDGYISSKYLLTGKDTVQAASTLIQPHATVLADKLRIRSAPEQAEGNTVGSAAAGEKYQILGHAGANWLMIRPDNIDRLDVAYMSALPENVSIDYGFDEARSLNLRQKVLNMYDNLGISLAGDYINIRSSAKEDGIANIVGKLPGFGGCSILGEENGWYKIKSGNVTGYVRADLLATGQTAQNLALQNAHVMAIVNTEALNVRSEASTNSQAWTKITSGQRYDVINQMDGWVQLDLDSGDDSDTEQGDFVSTRDNNVTVTYALQEAVEYYPAVEAANAAAAFRNKIVNFACQYVGGRYVWGGTSLGHGVDCSGFTQQVLKHFGISIPRVSRDQAKTGVKVTSKTMKPGDLIFYANRSGTVNHVGMYIGNGQVVNAASTKSGIRIYRWNYRTPVAIRNVIGD